MAPKILQRKEGTKSPLPVQDGRKRRLELIPAHAGESVSRSSLLAEVRQDVAPSKRVVRTRAGGCQGFTGPEPSTLLDELSRKPLQ